MPVQIGSNRNFDAQVDAWVHETRARLEAVFKESTKRTVSLAQQVGNIPIDTGFLRYSIRASLTAMPEVNPAAQPQKGARYQYNPADVVLTIASFKLGQTIYVGYTAAYARRIEYGYFGKDRLGRTYNQRPRGYIARAVAQWPATVNAVAAELKERVTARAGASLG